MLVNHKGLGLLGIGHSGMTAADSCLVLKPGVNEVTAEAWNRVKHNKGVLSRIEEGTLEVVGDEAKSADQPAEQVFKGLSIKEAVKLVNECIDADLLERISGADKRKEVQKAVKARLTLLAAPVARRSDEKAAAKEDVDGSDT